MKANEYLKSKKNELFEFGDLLFNTPELGYKEFKTKEILINYFKKNDFKIENEYFETGFSISIGKGKPHIGLIAELDALPTPGHRCASKIDNAAHSCGHSTQCAIMAYAMTALKKEGIPQGKITLFFTPSEEYTDISYKDKLIKEKKIKYYGGKINMLTSGMFNDIDCFIHLHMASEGKHFSVNGRLGGFVYKEITFIGKAAHAAVMAHLGINALNAYVLFDNAINMLRETFKEVDMVRVHGIIKEGGSTVNSIPDKVVYECYVRTLDTDTLIDIAKKIDNAAKYSSKAIGASCSIKTKPGYLPFIQEKKINDIIYKHMLEFANDDDICIGAPSIAASDNGDVSIFKPCVEFGYSGFRGAAHSKDVDVVDYTRAYLEPAIITVETVIDLLNNPNIVRNIKQNYKPRMTMKDYIKYINQK